jgi:hypothetical protein
VRSGQPTLLDLLHRAHQDILIVVLKVLTKDFAGKYVGVRPFAKKNLLVFFKRRRLKSPRWACRRVPLVSSAICIPILVADLHKLFSQPGGCGDGGGMSGTNSTIVSLVRTHHRVEVNGPLECKGAKYNTYLLEGNTTV